METTSRSKFSVPPSYIWAACFFVVLWLLDFPRPMIDDLFYTGAGLNLAAGGDFSNPLLARQGFPSHFYFVYPPFHSFALAGWLRVFGIGAQSITAFQCLMYLLSSWASIAVLRRHHSRWWLEWLVPPAATTSLIIFGLRPEAFAIALIMVGFAAGARPQPSSVCVFCSFLLMFLGAAAAPRPGIFAFTVAGWTFYRCFLASPNNARTRWKAGILVTLSLVTTLMLLLVLIGFRVTEYGQTFSVHASRLGFDRLVLLRCFFTVWLGLAQWPVFFAAFGFVLLVLRRPTGHLAGLAVCLAATCLLAVVMRLLGPGTFWFVLFMLLAAVSALVERAKPAQATAIGWLVTLLLVLALSRPIIEMFGVATGRITWKAEETWQDAAHLRFPSGTTVLVDETTARYVYDYRLPTGALDWNFAAVFPGTLVTDDPLVPKDVYVLGPRVMAVLAAKGLLHQPVQRWTPLWLSRWSYPAAPRRTFVVTVENSQLRLRTAEESAAERQR